MRRWVYRILIAVGALLVLLVAGVQAVLWTNVPKDVVVAKLEQTLGLRVSAKSVSTGWFGHTTLRDVSLSLPLSSDSFLSIPELDVTHTSLPWMAITQGLEIQAADFKQPKLYVRQDAGGRWNLQDVATLIARAGGSQQGQAQAQQQKPTPKLPAVTVEKATVIVLDNKGRTATIEPFGLDGKPDGPLVYEYDASIPSHLDLKGRLAVGGNWAHEVEVSLQQIDPWLSPWVKKIPDPNQLKVKWEGQMVAAGAVGGRLLVEKLQVGNRSASGPVQINSDGTTTTLRPTGLKIDTGGNSLQDVVFSGGSLVVNSAAVQADHLLLASGGGQAEVTGRYGLADGASQIQAAWKNMAVARGVTQGGELTAELSSPWPNLPKITASVHSFGETDEGKWDTKLNLNGQSSFVNGVAGGWKNMRWGVEASQLHWAGNKFPMTLNGVSATIVVAETQKPDAPLQHLVTLEEMHLASGRPIAGHGEVDLDNRRWWVTVDGRDWQIPELPDNTVDADLNAWGNSNVVGLNQFYARVGSMVASASGSYVFDKPQPVSAHVYVFEVPDLSSEKTPIVQGNLHADAQVGGVLFPKVELSLTGNLDGNGLVVRNRMIGDVDIDIKGTVTGRLVSIQKSGDFKLLGGDWDFEAAWPVKEGIKATLKVKNLPLDQLAESPDITGTLDGEWGVALYHPTITGVNVTGGATLQNVRWVGKVNGNTQERFVADRIEAPSIQLHEGQLEIKPVKLARHDGSIDGRATATLSMDLAEGQMLNASLSAAAWPLHPTQFTKLIVWANATSVEVNVKNQSATGHATLEADASGRKQEAHVHLKADTDLLGRIVRINSLDADSLGGHAHGQGSLNVDDWVRSSGTVSWSGIQATDIVDLFPKLEGLEGSFGGAMIAGPAVSEHPLEPLSIQLVLTNQGAAYRTIPVGEVHAHAYAGVQTDTRMPRVVLDDAPRANTLNAAGGLITFWGRASEHAGAEIDWQKATIDTLLNVEWVGLDLNLLVHGFDRTAKPAPGLVSGQFTGHGNALRPETLGGDGFVTLSQSDLANVGFVSFLYDAMHLGHDTAVPTGAGRVDLHLESQALSIPGMRYFNRGVEARATMVVANVFDLDSDVSGAAVGSARPLKSIKLPFLADVDQIFSVLQGNLTSVRISGTVRHPKFEVVPFNDIGQGLRELILGDVKSETGTTAG